MSEQDIQIEEGDRLRLLLEEEKEGQVNWSVPISRTFSCRLPAGTVFVAERPVAGAGTFVARPINEEDLEGELVPEGIRESNYYRGYYFIFEKEEVGRSLERVEPQKGQEDEDAESGGGAGDGADASGSWVFDLVLFLAAVFLGPALWAGFGPFGGVAGALIGVVGYMVSGGSPAGGPVQGFLFVLLLVINSAVFMLGVTGVMYGR